jgi:hypothetical protein
VRNRYYRKYVEYLNREETDEEWTERLADEINWLIDSVQDLQRERAARATIEPSFAPCHGCTEQTCDCSRTRVR